MDVTATDLSARSGTVTLAGSLWRPDRTRAAIVMHPGSGPSDRHNDDLFARVRPLFLAAGIAIASFDKRGVGQSEGDWRDAAIEDQADDAMAAVAALRAAVPDVPVGIYGHSQGGWVVVEAAGRPELDPAFVISSSGPAVSMVDQERFALDRAVERLSPEQASAIRSAFAQVIDGWRAAPGFAVADERLRAIADPDALAWLRNDLWLQGGEKEWNLARRLAGHDPVPALGRIAAPLLVVYGGDERIVPVEASVEVLRRAVRPDLLTIAVLPGGDHRLQCGEPPALVRDLKPTLAAFLDRTISG